MKKGKSPAHERRAAEALYRAMLLIRLTERKIIELYPTDKIQSPVHLSIGQEAVSAGTCLAMSPEDRIYGTYRGHGLYIAKDGDLNRLFAELYGKDAGCARGKGGSMHLTAPDVGLMGCSAIVSSTIPLAVGHALAERMAKRKGVVVAFFGDGGVDEGVFYESVNFAVLRKLPVLFLCENNGYAIHSKVPERRAQTKLHKVCEGLGMKGARVDGNDVFAVHKAVASALKGLRAGGPPVFLEASCHRWHEHVGPGMDYQERYRLRGEQKAAEKNDPLVLAARALARRFQAGPEALEAWKEQAERKIAEAVRFAEACPFPGPERLFADIFA